ncbi:hypothetical protein ACPW7J_09660 [Ihubacter sp. rT4E-8]|uniref:hypothetical protein n=1 Tax=Ihubacter sp. rT4E-8 TaxID=3242369 RepID=UPI003CF26B62
MSANDSRQLEILLSLSEVDYHDITDIPRELRATYDYLEGEHLVKLGYRDVDGHRPFCASITEAGKSYLAGVDIDNKRYRQTFRIDIASLIISIIAIIIAIIK